MLQESNTKRIVLTTELRARPTRVFQALLSPDDLGQWFCTSVQTAPHTGGEYTFWGPTSVATLYEEGEGGGPIHGLEAPSSLWYAWTIAGQVTDVVFYISPSKTGTTLQLIHQGLASGSAFMDFWHLRLAALKGYVEGRSTPGLYNYTARPITDIHHEVLVRQSPAEVFKALIDSALVSQWMNAKASIDARVGGLYDLGWRDPQGYMAGPQEIFGLQEGATLSYRYQYGDAPDIGTEVHFTLVAEPDGTLVSVEHLGFDPQRDNRDYDQGWLQLLWSLKGLVEEGRMVTEVLDGGWDL